VGVLALRLPSTEGGRQDGAGPHLATRAVTAVVLAG